MSENATMLTTAQSEHLEAAARLLIKAARAIIGDGNPAHSEGQKAAFLASITTQACFRALYDPDNQTEEMAPWILAGSGEGLGMILSTVNDAVARQDLFQRTVTAMSVAMNFVHQTEGRA